MPSTNIVGAAMIGVAVVVVFGVAWYRSRVEAGMPRDSFTITQSKVVTGLLGFVALWPVALTVALLLASRANRAVYSVALLLAAIAVVLFVVFFWSATWRVRVDGDVITIRRLFRGTHEFRFSEITLLKERGSVYGRQATVFVDGRRALVVQSRLIGYGVLVERLRAAGVPTDDRFA